MSGTVQRLCLPGTMSQRDFIIILATGPSAAPASQQYSHLKKGYVSIFHTNLNLPVPLSLKTSQELKFLTRISNKKLLGYLLGLLNHGGGRLPFH